MQGFLTVSSVLKKSNGVLVFHERMRESDQLHKCNTCGKKFTGNLRCTAHQVGPKVVKCFTCLTCSKAFQWNCNLNIHKRMHTVISRVIAHPRAIAHPIFWANIDFRKNTESSPTPSNTPARTLRSANTHPTRMTRPRTLQLEDVRDKVKRRRERHFFLFTHFLRERPQSGRVSVRKENDGDNKIRVC